jgi:death-on-curing protein
MPFRIYPTVAEAIEIHQLLIEEFGGLHGIRDQALLESAIFRPQSGYYNDLFEEAAALMESLSNNQAFLDGNKRVSFVLTDVMLRANGYFLDVDPLEAHKFINDAIAKKEFRFSQIRDWIVSITKPLED